MTRDLYKSLDALLDPSTFASIEDRPVMSVDREDFHSVDGLSGGTLLRVSTDKGRYILKRFAYDSDWIMQVTADHQARAIVSWTSGLLDALPAEIDHEILACAREGNGWAILLRDVSEAMIPPGDDPISAQDHARFVESMAGMHAALMGRTDLVNPAAGFCSLSQRYSSLTPRNVRALPPGSDAIPPMILDGWSLLPSVVGSDVASVIADLLENPQPLCDALGRFPQTVVHGDWKLGNLGIHRDSGNVVLLDWAFVGPAPAPVDLAWYLAVNCARMPISKEETIAMYRGALEAGLGSSMPDADWQPQLQLALLGGFLLLGWPKALGFARSDNAAVRDRERAELDWWSERVREGARWL